MGIKIGYLLKFFIYLIKSCFKYGLIFLTLDAHFVNLFFASFFCLFFFPLFTHLCSSFYILNTVNLLVVFKNCKFFFPFCHLSFNYTHDTNFIQKFLIFIYFTFVYIFYLLMSCIPDIIFKNYFPVTYNFFQKFPFMKMIDGFFS